MSGRTGRNGLVSLAGANTLALLAGAGASFAYARWLDAGAFAQWAMALTLARSGLLLLDGGLRTVLVRQASDASAHTWHTLRRWTLLAAWGLSLLLALAVAGASALGWLAPGAALLLVAYPCAYLVSYPALLPALARLERSGRFGALGRIEGATVLIELLLPALLMAAGLAWWASFSIGAVLARVWRTWRTVLADAHAPPPAAAASMAPDEAPRLLREGLAQQGIHALAMLRDNMHLWLLVPLFGQAWAGQYAFAHAATALICQPLVLTGARVLLPQLRGLGWLQRRQTCMAQIRALCLLCLPLMAVLPMAVASVDGWLGAGKWHDGQSLLPWLGLRMVGGIVSTVLATWLGSQLPARAALHAHARWTAVECLGALAGLALWGPIGLAIASAFTIWYAAIDFCAALAGAGAPVDRSALLRETLASAAWRPSLAIALLGVALWQWQAGPGQQWWPLIVLLPVLAWLAEPQVRQTLRAAAARPLRTTGA